MCGRLARHLRILGQDAEWVNEKERKRILYRALKENRILITRDRRYEKSRGVKRILLKSEKYLEQLQQIRKELNLNFTVTFLFQRCSFCNQPVQIVEKKQVEGRVPPFIYEKQKKFFQCQKCGRIYWQGTHKELFEKQLAGILKSDYAIRSLSDESKS